MIGTIIFYNLDSGTGLVLSEEKNKYNFDVEAWDDLDNLPAIGLKVEFKLQDENIMSIFKYEKKNSLDNIDEDISIQTAKKIMLNPDFENESLDQKLDPDLYSTKTVPKDFINSTMKIFFSSLQETVDKYKNYELNSHGESLDYFKIKRFLFTAYNNLLELDSSLANGSLTEIYQNIQNINGIHDVYKKSYMYPKIAFSTIFLRYTRYKEAKRRLEKNIANMQNIKSSLGVMEAEIKQKVTELDLQKKDDVEYVALRENIKHLKSLYVDAIDKMGTLREENEILLPITDEYFELFFEEFSEKFVSSYESNIKNLVSILNSMAFLFDRLMWEKASHSKIIKNHFEESNIPYPYSSLTFLRYYLRTLNKSKLNEENRELFELLRYLEKQNDNG